MLLGVKGTLFAAELHILRARMRGNLLNKARRGELALRLPVGYRRLGDGIVVLEPEEQVRQTLTRVFERFSVLRNARAVQREPHRLTSNGGRGDYAYSPEPCNTLASSVQGRECGPIHPTLALPKPANC